MQALTAARDTLHQRTRLNDPAGDSPTLEQQQADALALLAETALHHGMDPGAPAEHYQIVVHVDAGVLADAEQPGQSALEEGSRVSAETSQRLACDASRVVMRHDEQHRDHGCRFPGCGVPVGQGHHIRHWANGGPTTLSNLAMLCRRHHRAVHEEGFQVERQADGELCFRRPDGSVIAQIPARPRMSSDPAAVLRARNDADGIHIDAQTSKPGWHGEWLDVGYAIDVLHPAATGERMATS